MAAVVNKVFCLWGICSYSEGELLCFVLTAVLFACCVNVQIKHIIMTESRYDKYGECQGSFIIMTAEIVSWPAGTRQNTLVYWKGLKMCLPWLWSSFSSIFFQEVLKKVVAVSEEFHSAQRPGRSVGASLLSCIWFTLLSEQ